MQRTESGTCYHLKDASVKMSGTPAQEAILDAAAQVYAATEQPLVVTSAEDGTHMEGSLHYDAKALDLRVWDLGDHERAAAQIQEILGRDYDVIAEWRVEGEVEVPSHIHAEHDPA
jgi:hypothetical protein